MYKISRLLIYKIFIRKDKIQIQIENKAWNFNLQRLANNLYNLYQYLLIAQMLLQGFLCCGRKLECPEKTHTSKRAPTKSVHITVQPLSIMGIAL